MLLYGAGGHAKVLISCVRSSRMNIRGIFDDNPEIKDLLGTPVLGKYDESLMPEEGMTISIGNNAIRKQIAGKVSHCFRVITHPSALIDPNVHIGQGTVCLHRCVIQSGATIGCHVIINTGTIVEHDCRIGDFVHLAPGVVICGNVSIGEGTLIGAGSVVIPNILIGRNCLVAAGSVVTSNILDNAIVRGNPARIIRIAS